VPTTLMQFKVCLPAEFSMEKSNMVRIVAEPRGDSCGNLPRRFDCVAEIVAGILLFETEVEDEVYAAVDARLLAGTGQDGFASMRQALLGTAAGPSPYPPGGGSMALGGRERFVRSVMAKLEAEFQLRFATFQYELQAGR